MWKVLKAVDLSLPIDSKTPVYPGDPEPTLKPVATIGGEGYNLHRIILGTHTGTHVDAPYHFWPEGATIDRLPLGLFIAEAVIVPVRDKQPRQEIALADIKPVEKLLRPGAAVLFNTNWYRRAGTPQYLEHPYLGIALCSYLLERGIRTFGIDAINIDLPGDAGSPVHGMIAAAGGVIVENLANLDQVDFAHPLVVFFPLKLAGCDGSPVRAVALLLEQF
jgi:kynurenine formamidase